MLDTLISLSRDLKLFELRSRKSDGPPKNTRQNSDSPSNWEPQKIAEFGNSTPKA